MSGDLESLTSRSSDQPPQGGQQEQESQEDKRSSSSSSNRKEGHIINEENNKNEENGSRFVVDVKTTTKFETRSKITVSVLKDPIFPISRQIVIQVSDIRSMDFVDMVVRGGNGKNALNVEIPLKISKDQVLVMILVDYRQNLKGIVYDQEKGTVTCSDGVLSTMCKDAVGLASLDSEEMKVIDELLAKYLETLLWGPETTKSAEGEIKEDCICFLFLIYCLFIL